MSIRARWVVVLYASTTLLLAHGSALAHEGRTIANGKYQLSVGWDIEPAFEGQKNAASIRITRAGSSPPEPVTGAKQTLKLQIRQGGQTRDA